MEGDTMISTQEKYKIIDLRTINDNKGILGFFEEGRDVPFSMVRGFFRTRVPKGAKPGGHAHHKSWQFHLCIGGTADVLIDDGTKRETIILEPGKALIVNKMVWSEFELSSLTTVLLVMSSDLYDKDDYIRDYNEFLKALR